jgi:hypothetical protein
MTAKERPNVYQESPLPTRSALDETRGILCYSAADLGIDPDERLALATLSLRLGHLLGPQFFTNSPTNDPVINVTAEDIDRISAESLSHGLYIFSDDPRYKDGEQLLKTTSQTTVSNARGSKLKLPFEPTYQHQPAVVFGSQDYLKLGLYPSALATRIQSRTQDSNRGRVNVSEVTRRKKSSVSQAMASYAVQATVLKDRYIEEGKLVRRLFRQVRQPEYRGHTPQNQYKVRNLDRDCRQFGWLFRDMVETAAINNRWTTHDIHAAHKASVAERYRADQPEEINAGWRRQLGVYGLYNNARLFKLMQSLRVFETYGEMYRPFVREVIAGQAG